MVSIQTSLCIGSLKEELGRFSRHARIKAQSAGSRPQSWSVEQMSCPSMMSDHEAGIDLGEPLYDPRLERYDRSGSPSTPASSGVSTGSKSQSARFQPKSLSSGQEESFNDARETITLNQKIRNLGNKCEEQGNRLREARGEHVKKSIEPRSPRSKLLFEDTSSSNVAPEAQIPGPAKIPPPTLPKKPNPSGGKKK